jgi:alpha-methylacyl-CoA racemase
VGPLEGVKVIEIAGIGPGPFCAMVLADLGADVIRVDRADNVPPAAPPPGSARFSVLNRGRPNVAVDLKKPEGVELVMKLVEGADVLLEGFRPGVVERLGLGPEVCLKRNPRLIFGRMTGWGQEGPLAQAAGHDINYIAITGALHAIGRKGERPVPPLNLVGDFGGGGLMLALGIVCALVERQRSGRGQVVDAAMVDGAAYLMTMFYGMLASGGFKDERGVNRFDGAAPNYDTYECSDGKFVAVGALEPQFYAELLARIGLDKEQLPANNNDPQNWTALKDRLCSLFKTKTRDEWAALLAGTDACFSPVLSMTEAMDYPANTERSVFTDVEGIRQPAPAPRFSRTPGAIRMAPATPGQHTDVALKAWGVSDGELARLRAAGAIK